MTPADLIPIIREDFLVESPDSQGSTPEAAYNWKTAFLLREINNAVTEACRRQDLRHIYDDSTAEICSIAVTAGVPSYALDSRILRLESVRSGLPSPTGSSITHTTMSELDSTFGGQWRSWAAGLPRYFFVAGRAIRLVPSPSASDVLALSVWREPIAPAAIDDEIEWPGDHRKLCHWVAAMAFMRPHEATFRADLGKIQMAMFDQAVGAPVSEQARAELLRLPGSLSMLRRISSRFPLLCEDQSDPWSRM